MNRDIKTGRCVGVVSDTHGSLSAWNSALKLFGEGVGMLLHAGDVLYSAGPSSALAAVLRGYEGNLLIARGNCDTDFDVASTGREFPHCVKFEWMGKKILVMHGDDFQLFQKMARANRVDLAISGHTHVASVVREGSILFLNPGSTTRPKGRHPASAAVVREGDISILTLDGGLLHYEGW